MLPPGRWQAWRVLFRRAPRAAAAAAGGGFLAAGAAGCCGDAHARTVTGQGGVKWQRVDDPVYGPFLTAAQLHAGGAGEGTLADGDYRGAGEDYEPLSTDESDATIQLEEAPEDLTCKFQDMHEAAYRPPYPTNPDNSIVFFDMAVEDEPIGRIEFELFDDTAPKHTLNFKCICTGYHLQRAVLIRTLRRHAGEIAFPRSRRQNCYRNTLFHCIRPGFIAQGGDTVRFDGKGGEPIFDHVMHDEVTRGKAGAYIGPGLLGMATHGRHSNNSQFFITYRSCPWLNKKKTCFGQVVRGWGTMKRLEKEGTNNGKPRREVSILDCGILKQKSGKLFDDSEQGDPAIPPENPKKWIGKGAGSLTKDKFNFNQGVILREDKENAKNSHWSGDWFMTYYMSAVTLAGINPRRYDWRGGDGTGGTKMLSLPELAYEDPSNCGCGPGVNGYTHKTVYSGSSYIGDYKESPQ